ncbi:MAG TPA: hypothetical protein VLT36_16880, partial [Candidatus Dormibacteraeota bacterium]|nr:hypothetical protein [Candidatus Dormibacteraeota bacterium]
MSPRSSNPYLIQFIRNYTAEPIGTDLQEAAKKFGIQIELEFGAYENLGMEIAEIASADPSPAVAVITIDLEYFAGGLYSPLWDMSRTNGELQSLLLAVDRIPAKTLVLLSTFLPPFNTSIPWTPGHPVLGRAAAAFELNQVLREFVAQRPTRCGLLDFERIAARLGEAATLDRRFGLMNKAPFKEEFVNAAAAEIARFLRARYLPP